MHVLWCWRPWPGWKLKYLQCICQIWCSSRSSCRARVNYSASGSSQWSANPLPQHFSWCGALQTHLRDGGSRETSAHLRLGRHVWRCNEGHHSLKHPQWSHSILSGNQRRVLNVFDVQKKKGHLMFIFITNHLQNETITDFNTNDKRTIAESRFTQILWSTAILICYSTLFTFILHSALHFQR